MLPPGLSTPREVVLYQDELYFSRIDSGKAHPFIYPWAAIGAVVVILYLLIDHRQSVTLRWLRYPVFALLVAFQAWCTQTNRARNSAAAFGVGLISCWGCLWVASIMIFNDCQADFKRIERLSDGETESQSKPATDGTANGSAHASSDLRQRRSLATSAESSSTKGPAQRHGKLFWQSYPTAPMTERLDWVADVFCSFRGVGWTWQTSGIPPPPRWVEAQLDGKDDIQEVAEPIRTSNTGIRRYGDRSRLVRDAAISLVIGYITLDVAKTIMNRDPYFWGYVDAPAPTYLPAILRHSYTLTHLYRLLVSLSAIYTALWTIFKLGPAFFCGVLGPKWLGVRGEAWQNPLDMYGSFSLVLDKGLAGWWGGWWHQTFRFAFEVPATRLMGALGVDKRSPTGKALSLFVAFFLSGCIHACGSYTQLGDTRPILGPMRFFLLQGVGILAQTLLVQLLAKAGITTKCPKTLCQLTNLVVVHVWLYYTAPLLVDDFARGGVWLYEPIPFSPLRGLGFGAPDDHFFCWWYQRVWWRTGKHWWDTGISL
ncbi:hypothetical protein LTR36_009332 [Oleoguttula mirabilis]|uniref:Wax synthase domain-containing protein n=1 Tax=Oleoguttula mirabilis TaxID=1507867 RepID=A0AAV9JRX1_9PEZI|nr:hypothetical protein LTR36_009332 [Oleoguttula mirabilis]